MIAAELPGILERAAEAGVTSVLLAGTTLESTRECIGLAAQFDAFYAGVGIHPCQAYERVEDETYAELERLAQSPKVVCISEVGLDYLPESLDHAVQDQVFRAHIRLAKSLDLPIIFHSREAHSACFQVLREEAAGDVGGAMHYFQADEATGAGGHRLRLLHLAGAAADPAGGGAGGGASDSTGEHRAGDGRLSPAVQEVPPQLDRAAPCGRGGPVFSGGQGRVGGGSSGGDHRQSKEDAEPG